MKYILFDLDDSSTNVEAAVGVGMKAFRVDSPQEAKGAEARAFNAIRRCILNSGRHLFDYLKFFRLFFHNFLINSLALSSIAFASSSFTAPTSLFGRSRDGSGNRFFVFSI
jgi:hypothetical protein